MVLSRRLKQSWTVFSKCCQYFGRKASSLCNVLLCPLMNHLLAFFFFFPTNTFLISNHRSDLGTLKHSASEEENLHVLPNQPFRVQHNLGKQNWGKTRATGVWRDSWTLVSRVLLDFRAIAFLLKCIWINIVVLKPLGEERANILF